MTTQAESNPSEAQRKPNRRRRLIVDKAFQYRLIGLLLAIWAENSLFFSIILYYFYQGHILRFYHLVPRSGLVPLLSAPVLPWCINTGKSLIPLTLLFLHQKRNLLIPLELSRVMHQGTSSAELNRCTVLLLIAWHRG